MAPDRLLPSGDREADVPGTRLLSVFLKAVKEAQGPRDEVPESGCRQGGEGTVCKLEAQGFE